VLIVISRYLEWDMEAKKMVSLIKVHSFDV
jgi:hypothetical protein